ncbi:malonate-semialdehyde dehydrogenase (acetylating)/methylmalonate-semialdehyde dehydrogenase [Scopulibacillus daqui]|uniref:Malonate-semialdehyde dehydrogenase n=1 Tax=Scopulibacillus daqui TaxID=1469162 RepID=A0ABS2Q1S1_9BACL|nr:malonate-semialdehyde dehydrogenase (acetylating)/methylmalonate-semialdehyde dehydrogenase [Scopulibacillus daqui]
MTVTTSKVETLKNFINGKWVPSSGSDIQDVPNPATEEIVARVPISTSDDVNKAAASAKEAFKTWSKTPVQKRARILYRFHHLLMENQDDLANMITRENGKSINEAYGEVLRGIECVEFACGAPSLMMGDSLSTIGPHIDSEMYRYPLGVVGGITPFNFPMMVPCWMFPLAIACGNTFVLKPSERTPVLANRLAELLKEAGLPDGVFNIVHGAHDVVNSLIEHKDIRAVSFVGSQPVAKYVYEKASSFGKRVQALSGAKNHHVVMPDADVEQAADSIISSAFGSAGQRCMACSAVVVVGDGERFVQTLKQAADEMKMGNGIDENVVLTPVIRGSQRQRAVSYIEKGLEEGAELIRDGRKDMENFDKGYFLGATIFDHVKPDMSIGRDEIFAPVLSLYRAKDLDEALDIVNRSQFGNSATLYSNDAKAIRQFREEAEPGMLGVNVGVPVPMAFFPFSGAKDSFYGDLHTNGKDGVEFYTRKKMFTTKY